jgi:NADH dehydrogenase/NADH:ubiquinone oxidoreductase subunit G
VAGRGLEHRAGLRGRRPEAREGRVRRRRHRRRRQRPRHGRRTAPAGQAGARPGQREHRPPHPPRRLRQPAAPGKARWLGTSIASLSTLDRAFVIGSFLRKDHPLFAQRIRQAARQGAQVHSLHAVHDDWLLPVAPAPDGRARRPGPQALAEVAAAVAAKGVAAPVAGRRPAPQAQAIAASLLSGERKAVLLGNAAAQHPQAVAAAGAGPLDRRADAGATSATWARPPTPWARSWSARAGCQGGLSAAQMLSQPMKALLLLDVEPVLDAADAAAAQAALAGLGPGGGADAAFKDAAVDNADVLLPIAPFTETAGTFVNAEGRAQSFTASSSRWAMRARPGRCCACWATCWAWKASRRRPARRCAPRRWATWPRWPRAWTTPR